MAQYNIGPKIINPTHVGMNRQKEVNTMAEYN